ncbi:MAG: yjdG-like N-acetyltransferase [Marmoricola sp.]|nr:yjdG-like N-acetyltransferase [Marmoricola sp.]
MGTTADDSPRTETDAARDGRAHLILLTLPLECLDALISGDLPAASAAAGIVLTDYFSGPETVWLWKIRAEQLRERPGDAPWIARAAFSVTENTVVGHAGFHSAPDDVGMVEVAYEVQPEFRRRGYATAMLAALVDRAVAEPSVRVIRASVSPDNAGSLATIAHFGFHRAGEQWDEEDGLELVFERSAEPAAD